MKHKIFVIFDSAAAAYLPPFNLHQEAMAVRAFANMVMSKEHQFGLNPSDYTLFVVGEFDDANAKYELLNAPEKLANGIELLKREKETLMMPSSIKIEEINKGISQ